MTNIAALLKTEIARIARKEVRREIEHLKKASAGHRSGIASTKRKVDALEKQVQRLSKGRAEAKSEEQEADGASLRFSAKGLANHRKRLGLSARECGLLVGASGLSVYKWEKGAARPGARYLPAIAALRSMGKREVTARLQELG